MEQPEVLAVITLWALTMFLGRKKGYYWLMTLIPAVFMTFIVLLFILYSEIGAGMPYDWAAVTSAVLSLLAGGYAIKRFNKTDGRIPA